MPVIQLKEFTNYKDIINHKSEHHSISKRIYNIIKERAAETTRYYDKQEKTPCLRLKDISDVVMKYREYFTIRKLAELESKRKVKISNVKKLYKQQSTYMSTYKLLNFKSY